MRANKITVHATQQQVLTSIVEKIMANCSSLKIEFTPTFWHHDDDMWS